jgi:hypothetical protein
MLPATVDYGALLLARWPFVGGSVAGKKGADHPRVSRD